MKRRKMLQSSVLSLGGICSCSLVFGRDNSNSDSCFTPELNKESYIIQEGKILIDLDKANTIRQNGYATFIINKEKKIDIILVHDKPGKFYALQRLCTHGGRSLSFIKERNLLQCNNFNHSTFTMQGEVYNGPAPQALASYEVTVIKNTLEISI